VAQTTATEWRAGDLRHFEDAIVGEEPLEIRVGNRPLSVTMRTPGNDLELAAGFLFTEGIICGREDISGLRHQEANGQEQNLVVVELRPGVVLDLQHTQRNFVANSSCGLCGKASIKLVRVRGIPPPNANFRVEPEILCRLPETLRAAQEVFDRTGGLHASAIFDSSGALLALREDVGRHNAVDKVIGWALLEGLLPLSKHIMLVSGRGGFEIVQKALVAGLPVVASVSAPSSLAVQLAKELNLTLIGFLRGQRFVIYAGEERLAPVPQLTALARTD
jgi:FdhD protein